MGGSESETGDFTERGPPILRIEVVGQGEVIFVPNADDIVRCIGTLRRMAQSQNEKIKGKKSKKHMDFALDRWVSDAAAIWIDLLGRNFSHQKTSANEPLTRAVLKTRKLTKRRRIGQVLQTSSRAASCKTFIESKRTKTGFSLTKLRGMLS